jgi:two-component system, NarL family, nitrate/nitrite response regulator NarL
MDKCHVALVGDNRLFLEGLSLMLESEDATVACATNRASELLPLLTTIDDQPNLIIWDSPTNLDQDITRWAEIHREYPKIGIVVLTEQSEVASVNRALAAGVRGVLPKCISTGALSLSLRLIALGEDLNLVPFGLEYSWRETVAAPGPIKISQSSISLSSRETEILEGLRAGSPNKVIARELDLAEATVKVHVKTLLRKINVTNRTQAAVWSQTRQYQNWTSAPHPDPSSLNGFGVARVD